MTHLDEGTVQALLHGELDAPARAEAEAHATSCPVCRTLLEQARDDEAWIRGRLAVLDKDEATREVPAWTPPATPARTTAAWRRAAGIVVLIGGGGLLWAMPAVRSWIVRAAQITAPRDTAGRAGAPRPDSTTRPVETSGVAALPGAQFVVDVRGEGTTIRLRLVDRAEVSVVAGSGNAEFESSEGRVRVRTGRNVVISIDVPREARLVEVLLNGRRVCSVGVGTLTPSSSPDADGWHLLETLR